MLEITIFVCQIWENFVTKLEKVMQRLLITASLQFKSKNPFVHIIVIT